MPEGITQPGIRGKKHLLHTDRQGLTEVMLPGPSGPTAYSCRCALYLGTVLSWADNGAPQFLQKGIGFILKLSGKEGGRYGGPSGL